MAGRTMYFYILPLFVENNSLCSLALIYKYFNSFLGVLLVPLSMWTGLKRERMGGLLADLVADGRKGQGCRSNSLFVVDEFRMHS